jgi:hypothetical protein
MINHFKRTALYLAVVASLVLCVSSYLSAAESNVPTASGKISVDWSTFEGTPTTLRYGNAHATMSDGTILDSDALIFEIDPSGHGKSSVKDIKASGHFKAVYFTLDGTKKYKDTATADEGTYYPATNKIILNGSVVITMYNAAIEGPLTQTGTSALIYLAPPGQSNNPEYPKIEMQQGHTTGTLKQNESTQK